jgi:hypothetical protein
MAAEEHKIAKRRSGREKAQEAQRNSANKIIGIAILGSSLPFELSVRFSRFLPRSFFRSLALPSSVERARVSSPTVLRHDKFLRLFPFLGQC